MFSEKPRKILTIAIIIPIFFAACNFWKKTETDVPPVQSPATGETQNLLPFANFEPEIYQAEIVTQIFSNGEKTERKIFTARSKQKRLTIFDVGEKTEIALLITGDGQTFSIYKAEKVYAQNATATNVPAATENDFLTTEWLNAKSPATFENLGTENNLTKFLVRLNDSPNSEILIYEDENLKIPVRQEFYEVEVERKNLTYAVEVKNFNPVADEKIFELPKDYRQISPPQLQDIIWREKLKND